MYLYIYICIRYIYITLYNHVRPIQESPNLTIFADWAPPRGASTSSAVLASVARTGAPSGVRAPLCGVLHQSWKCKNQLQHLSTSLNISQRAASDLKISSMWCCDVQCWLQILITFQNDVTLGCVELKGSSLGPTVSCIKNCKYNILQHLTGTERMGVLGQLLRFSPALCLWVGSLQKLRQLHTLAAVVKANDPMTQWPRLSESLRKRQQNYCQ